MFDRERFLVVRFEDYVAERTTTIADISRFLGVAPRPELIESAKVANQGTDAPRPRHRMDADHPAVRIGLIAPPWIPVPPDGYGGAEAIIDVLARGLVADGHEVRLWASGDSTCPLRVSWRTSQHFRRT